MHKNTLIYYVTEFLGALVFSTPISTFFFTLHLGFSMGWAIFITTLAGFTSFLFEMPTGSWADRFGRKRMYIAGLAIAMIGESFYLWANIVPLFIISAVIIGFGSALMSGNIEAILHDNLTERGEEEKYKEVQANGYTFFFTGRAIACILGGVLYTITPLLPFVLTIMVQCVILAIFFFIDEPSQELSHEENDKKHIGTTFRAILNRPELVYMIIWLMLLSAMGNMYWFSYQPYLSAIGFKIVYVGAAFAIASAFSALGSNLLKRFQKTHSELRILQYVIYLLSLSSIGFWFFIKHPSILWIFPIIVLSLAFGTFMSLGNSFILKDIPATHKSAALSIFSFGITLWYFLFSGFIGFFIDRFSMERVYLGILVMVSILVIANLFVSRKFLYSKTKHA